MLTVIWIMFALASASWLAEFVLLVAKIESPAAVSDTGRFSKASNIVTAVVRMNVSLPNSAIFLFPEKIVMVTLLKFVFSTLWQTQSSCGEFGPSVDGSMRRCWRALWSHSDSAQV